VLLGWTFRSQQFGWAEAGWAALVLGLTGGGLFSSSRFMAMAIPLDGKDKVSRWVAWVIAAVVTSALWVMIGGFALDALARIPALGDLPRRFAGVRTLVMGMGVLLYMISLSISYLLASQKRAQDFEVQQGELRRLALDAELKALRAQINPHFLFNSLNSISALTTLDPGKAREMCVLLSDFLRKSLGLGERASVSLREELELLRTYLAIEQVRFGERLQIDWAVDPEAETLMLPPLLLQPLAENAIKHGISSLPEGGTLRIAARFTDEGVELEVANPCDPDAPAPKGLGLGLRQVRERLKGRFGTQSRFDALTRDCQHTVILTIPTEVP
jgi:sensor histidine kinase YesM